MATTTTANMSLILPVPSSELGPLWATEEVTAFNKIDAHDHSPGNGVRLPAAALSLSADVSFNASASSTGNNATGLRSTRYVSQASVLAGVGDLNALYFSSGNLYARNGSGTNVRITNGAGLDTSTLVSNVWVWVAKAADFTIPAGDTGVYYDVDCSAAIRTMTLPAANAVTAGRLYSIADTRGAAATFAITVAAAGADLIDGAATYVIRTNYGEVLLRSDGISRWKVMQSAQAIGGASVPAAGALVTGNTLQVTGTSALAYQALNLAGGTNYCTGVLPTAQIGAPAGDVTNTQAATRVTTITGSAGAVSLVANSFARPTAGGGTGTTTTIQGQDGTGGGGSMVFQSGTDSSASEATSGDFYFNRGLRVAMKITGTTGTLTFSSPYATVAGAGTAVVWQAQDGITAGAGGSFSIAAGAGVGAAGTGGGANLVSGAGAGTGLKGSVTLRIGNADALVQCAEVAAGRRVVGLARSSGVTATQMPVNTGDGVCFVGDAVTAPTATSVGGAIFYSDPSVGGLFTMYATSGGSAFGVAGATLGGSQSGASANSITVYVNGSPKKIPYY